MKLLVETIRDNIEYLAESDGSGNKVWKIRGIFAQAETRNRNGRIYPRNLMEREVERYNREKIQTRQSIGECEHPDGPNINLRRASHIIEKLEMRGNDVYGEARILNTRDGKDIQALLEAGVCLGISTRALGSLDFNKVVQEDFNLITADIVANPSAPKAYLESLRESKEYGIDAEGNYYLISESLKKPTNQKELAEALKMLMEHLKAV